MSRVSKGFTLVEVLIAGSISVVLLSVLFVLYERVSGVLYKTMIVNELQQNSELIARKLSSSVAGSDSGGAAFLSEAALKAISVHPLADVTSAGKKVYADSVTLFAWTPSDLTLKELHSDTIRPAKRFSPTRLDPDGIRSLAAGSHPKILSNRVVELTLTSPDGAFPLQIRIKLQQNAPHGGPQSIVLERQLCLRNIY
jgi:Tfp pilus assembly protein PilE